MGEGMHLETNTPAPATAKKPKSKWIKPVAFIAGTAAILTAGGFVMQSMSPKVGQAATETAGKATPTTDRPVKVMARVNKEIIPFDMVAEECVARYGKEVLDDIINRTMIQQACEAAGVTVTEEEVTAEINRIAKRFNLDVNNWYQMLQAERGINPQQYRRSVIWPMLALKKLASEKVDIKEEELNRAFVRNYGPRVKARMILMDNLRRATTVWEKVNADADNFEKYAQEFSIDPQSRALGGSVPPIPKYSGNDSLEKAAFALKEGEVSGVIEVGPSRFAIIKCEGRTVPTVNELTQEIRDSLYDELAEQKTQVSVAKTFEEIQKSTRIDNYLTATVTGPDRVPAANAPGANAPGAPQQPAAPTGAVRLGNRPANNGN